MPLKRFDAYLLRQLSDPEYALAYLNEALETGTYDEVLLSLRDVLRARHFNLEEVAREIGVTRPYLSKLINKGGNPTMETFFKIVRGIGLRLKLAVPEEDREAA